MSSHLNAKQNKTRLITVFLFTVLFALLFQVYRTQTHSVSTAEASPKQSPKQSMEGTKLDASLFVGLRHAKPAEIKIAMPETIGKPTVLAFGSRFCHDCQRMAPVLSSIMPQHPNLYYKKFDVQEDQKKYPAVFRTFQPVSVPMLVLINERSEIRNVLYDYQKPEVVSAAVESLEGQALSPKALKK